MFVSIPNLLMDSLPRNGISAGLVQFQPFGTMNAYGFPNRSLLLLLWFPLFKCADTFNGAQKCFFRCISGCLVTAENATDKSCWKKCKDLNPAKTLEAVSGIHVKEEDLKIILVFQPVRYAYMYIAQYKGASEADFISDRFQISLLPNIEINRPRSIFCESVTIRVAAVSSDGTSPFSKPFSISAPLPPISLKLEVSELVYVPNPLNNDPYTANGTVEITFTFNAGGWALGLQDLEVTPMLLLDQCEGMDAYQSVNVPSFTQGLMSGTVIGRVGSDTMYRECTFAYYAKKVTSRLCRTSTEIRPIHHQAPKKILISWSFLDTSILFIYSFYHSHRSFPCCLKNA
ncbi:unnamed protein product [Strongylus vulgaris]|uniref:Uncharacterized protein n=1 Tax=Strongylus vulgaris TaxID=40348 RepID=A0A3P7IC73_STRVU|nr:unnamed protein product [Strongylus vulgaris]